MKGILKTASKLLVNDGGGIAMWSGTRGSHRPTVHHHAVVLRPWMASILPRTH